MAAKNAGGAAAKTNTKIRFVMLEVDSTDGNLSEIAQAITNAVRPSLAVPRMVALPSSGGASAARDDARPAEQVGVAEEQIVEEGPAPNDSDAEGNSGRAPSVRAPRKYPMPTYLHDLDLDGGAVTFKAFAQQKAPKKNSKKYLVVAAWFREYGGKQAVTIDHVYTCYKTAGWSTNIADWDLSFRQLVKHDWMRRVQQGEYAITPLGEDEVKNIGG